SELLGNSIYQREVTITEIIFAIVVWGCLLFIIEYIFQKSLTIRQKLEGNPAILIRNGQIDFEQLKKSKLNLNQLQSLHRQSETFSIREVAFAILERNGSVSTLKRSAYQKTTLEDLNIRNQTVYLPVTIIRDGKLIKESLRELDKDEVWLYRQLDIKGIER